MPRWIPLLVLGLLAAGLFWWKGPSFLQDPSGPEPAVIEEDPQLRQLKNRSADPRARLIAARKALYPDGRSDSSSPAHEAWRILRDDPTLHGELEPFLRQWLEKNPDDPGLIRFLAAAYSAESAALRVAAIRAADTSSNLFLAAAVDEAMPHEKAPAVQSAWMANMKVRRPRAPAMATAARWLRTWESEKRQDLVDVGADALFGAARLSAPHTQQSLAEWWSARKTVVKGVDKTPGSKPWRAVTAAKVELRFWARSPRLLVAYRMTGEDDAPALAAKVLCERREVGVLHFRSGPEGKLRVATLEWKHEPKSDLSTVVELVFPSGPPAGLELRGFAVVRRPDKNAQEGVRIYGFDDSLGRLPLASTPNGAALSFGSGRLFEADEIRLQFEVDAAALDFSFKDPEALPVRHLHILHGSPSSENSVWGVDLNGRPMLTIISQPVPRPARADLRLLRLLPALRVGANELRFRRIRGAGILLDGIRLYP